MVPADFDAKPDAQSVNRDPQNAGADALVKGFDCRERGETSFDVPEFKRPRFEERFDVLEQ